MTPTQERLWQGIGVLVTVAALAVFFVAWD